jgi:bifunctional aspartokinase / homoserine dehydrogenase 1
MTMHRKNISAQLGARPETGSSTDDRHFDAFSHSTESLNRPGIRSSINSRGALSMHDHSPKAADHFPEHGFRHRLLHSQSRPNTRKQLRILKFGGTSVGDAPSIEQVVEIVRNSSREITSLVVVSAMSGVTNKLLEAAMASAVADRENVSLIFKDLHKRHDAAASELIHSGGERNRIGDKMGELLQEGERVCRGVMHVRQLTPQARDLILSIGERLSALLVAGALAERGVPSVALDATEIVVTDEHHGSAEPLMEPTRERCDLRLRPLLQKGLVPVVTGFIGATLQGAVTTLGRGSSDFSATILGAALDAHEIVIWTDVDGVLSADPRMVPGACSIPEMSYQEAAELAHFGAKVMHPKIFIPLQKSGIPLWVRNTFAPSRPGTKITPSGPACAEGALAITAKSDVALVTVGGPCNPVAPDALQRIFAAAAAIQSEVLLISQSSSQSEVRFVIPAASASDTVEALQREFAGAPAQKKSEPITYDTCVALITLVGQNMSAASGLAARTFRALDCENISIIAIANGSSESNLSFLVARKDMQEALVAAHKAFRPSNSNS